MIDLADRLHRAITEAVLHGDATAIDEVLANPFYRWPLLDAMGLEVGAVPGNGRTWPTTRPNEDAFIVTPSDAPGAAAKDASTPRSLSVRLRRRQPMGDKLKLMCPTCGSEVRGVTCVCGWYQGGVDEQQRAKWWATKPWRRGAAAKETTDD